jgi:hypothetical protein
VTSDRWKTSSFPPVCHVEKGHEWLFHVQLVERAVQAALHRLAGGRRVSLSVPDLVPTWCYSVEWTIRAAAGEPVKGRLHGTLH